MNKLADVEIRRKSLLANDNTLEHLYSFENFPVFMGCTDSSQEKDLVADMTWDICKKTGLIQLRGLLPLSVLYMDQHNDGTGKVWQEHYEAFAKFLHKYKPGNVLEIGGAHDHVARNYWELDPTARWTIVEPNPQHITSDKIQIIKAWFDNNFSINTPIDTVIHSHVFEHTYEPFLFIRHIGSFLKQGDRHIFTFPNMQPMLQRKWTNCLNFEHTVFLTEEVTDYILKKEGFSIIEKEYYGDPHSIFYATEKTGEPVGHAPMPDHYTEYKQIFTDYVDYHLTMIRELNDKISKSESPVYLFGAHIFSQTLIQFGLQVESVVSILDNSPLKQHKRLYGTKLMVESPEILRGKGPINVILKAGSYNKEIADQLFSINAEVLIW